MGLWDGIEKAFDAADLNAEKICDADGEDRELRDLSLEGKSIRIYFKELKGRLIRCIEDADYVFGCVAWLTDFDILEALSHKKGVAIVVNKEDFLRPDRKVNGDTFRRRLHGLYGNLPGNTDRYEFNGIVRQLSVGSDPGVEAVRCCGVRTRDRFGPRMHHKFAVFARAVPRPASGRTYSCSCWKCCGEPPPVAGSLTEKFGGRHWDGMREILVRPGEVVDGEPWWPWQPYRVWTGSFNWTNNATRSFENAVVIDNDQIAKAYYQEFQQVLALSESLDWESDYVDPEWRIGT
jgi:hypothetical protein